MARPDAIILLNPRSALPILFRQDPLHEEKSLFVLLVPRRRSSKYSETAPPADKTPNSVHYWNGWKVSEFKDTNSDSRASALYFFSKDDSPQAKTPDSDYEAAVKIAPLSDGTALGFVNDKHSDSRGRGFYVQIDKNGNAAPISTTMTQPSGKTSISVGQAALSEKILAGTEDASWPDAQSMLAQAKAYRQLANDLEERARESAALSSSKTIKPGFN